MDLNSQQKRAAETNRSRMLVLAGPGTGKTAALVGRYTALLKEGVAPESILCCTFSNKAANTLRVRIQKETGVRTASLPIVTFHSFAFRALREIGSLVGIKSDVTPWSSDDQRLNVVQDIQERLVKGRSYQDVPPSNVAPRGALEYIDAVRERLLDPEDASIEASEAGNTIQMGHAEVYAAYEDYLNQTGKADYPRMVHWACKALRLDNEAGGTYARRFTNILIDEYQDINFSQKTMVDLLLHAGSALWAVGDDDQAIYGWRGSNVTFILDFEVNYPGANKVKLELNYRCGSLITKLANNLTHHFKERHEKTVKSYRDIQGEIAFKATANEDDEALTIAEDIEARIANGVPAEEIAVLARTNLLPIKVSKKLSQLGISVLKGGGTLQSNVGLLRQNEARLLLSAVAESVGAAKTSDWDHQLTARLASFAQKLRDEDWSRIVKSLSTFMLNRPPKNASERLVEKRSRVIEYCRDFLLEFKGPEDAFTRLGSILNPKGVFTGTVHSAKGLEWDSVFLMGFEDGIFPISHNLGLRSLEEERRLAYVALTRAKNYLMLSTAAKRGNKQSKPSRFLVEMFGKFEKSKVKMLPLATTEDARRDTGRKRQSTKIQSFDEYYRDIHKAEVEQRRTEQKAARENREKVLQDRRRLIKEIAEKRREEQKPSTPAAAHVSSQNIADGSGEGGGWDLANVSAGFLGEAGYNAKKNGPSATKRQNTLTDVLTGRIHMPDWIKESVQEQWGSPNTFERLQKMRNTINVALGTQKAQSNPSVQAIDKWEADLSYIDEILVPQVTKEVEDG